MAPTYQSMGDHTETFEVDFDPSVITYAQLLDLFCASHDPTAASYGQQYRNLVLVRDDDQRRAAEASKERLAARIGRPVTTAIEPFRGFTRAEDYHQNFMRRNPRHPYILAHDVAKVRDLREAFPGDWRAASAD